MNSKLLALGAQERFQGEREREKEREERIRSQDLKLAGLMWALTGSVRPFIFFSSCTGFRPCMVPHRTRQQGSMRLFHSAKQLCKCSFISPSFLFFRSTSPAKSNSELYWCTIRFRPLG